MTQSDDWEPVMFRDLPDWVKEDSKPQRKVKNTYKTVFYGDPYDYMVQYTVDRGHLSISYWKTPHTFKREVNREKKPAKKIPRPSFRLLTGVLIFVLAAAGLILLAPSLPSLSIPSPSISSPAITSEVTVLTSPSLQAQSQVPVATTFSDSDFPEISKNDIVLVCH